MRYRIQVFLPAANAYVPTAHASDKLRPLRRLIAASPVGPTHTRIVDEATGVTVPSPKRPRTRPLTLQDIARVMGVPMDRKVPGE